MTCYRCIQNRKWPGRDHRNKLKSKAPFTFKSEPGKGIEREPPLNPWVSRKDAPFSFPPNPGKAFLPSESNNLVPPNFTRCGKKRMSWAGWAQVTNPPIFRANVGCRIEVRQLPMMVR